MGTVMRSAGFRTFSDNGSGITRADHADAAGGGGHPYSQPPSMSSSKAKVTKAAINPLSLEDTLHDLAVIRASGIDLAAILDSTVPAPAAAAAPTAADTTVARSHEFAQAARTAIKIRNRGDVEAQGERVNGVRGQLEEVVEGLVESSIRARVC